ncbi:hypothetical protein [Kitasatospora arboriphila]|uniref:Swt1-like HEPN domain-containing protein n=1 Tax=Kitasatospora arboriphila TaxID=258052 RepID=A0ABN1TH04_9ACTN
MIDDAAVRPTAADLLRLPGPRRHLARVAADLASGLGCLWLLPGHEVERGRADLYLDRLLADLDDVVEVPGPGGGRAARADGPAERADEELWPGVDAFGDVGFDYDDGLGGWTAPAAPAPAPPLGTPSLTERLAGQLGLVGDPVEELVDGADLRAPVVIVRAWREDDPVALSRLMRRLQAAVKNAGLPPARRPRLLVAARPEDLAPDAPEALDPGLCAVHWWWSVWGRLDTATLVAEAEADGRSAHGRHTAGKRILAAVRHETVVEVCGPDLPLAARLTGRWNGRTDDLVPALTACRPAAGAAPPPAANAAAAYAPSPEPSLRPAWQAGLLDSWEGQVRCSPVEWLAGADGRDRLDKLVWQAQNRVLLPLIDDARARLVALLPQAAARGARHLAATYVDRDGGRGGPADLASMELGDIWTAVRRRDVRFGTAQYNRLSTLRTSRNKLAHRRPLTDRELGDLVDALTG